MKKQYIIIAIVVVLFIGLFVWQGKNNKTKETEVATKTSEEVALDCTTDMATEYHIHPLLSIVINGSPVVIPANIGIVNGCMHPLHTHDATGLLHVESPVKKDFTLGNFFTVWNKPFDSMHILDFTADKAGEITVSVNGKAVDTFENTILVDKDEIIITAKK